MRKVLSALLVCLLIAFASAGRAAEQKLKTPEPPAWKSMAKESLAKLLKRGELASVDAYGPQGIEMCSIGILANAPPEKVWKSITDLENYGRILPNLLSPEVLEHTDKTALVKFNITVLKLSIITLATDFTLRYTFDKPRRAGIEWVSGHVKNVSGYWELYPVEGGKKTVVIYAITSDPASANPLLGEMLKEQPTTVMAINLTGAIIVARAVVKKAEKL
jgi:ribosome-associated toxin RatA of RatAB toxin-antitoxin module